MNKEATNRDIERAKLYRINVIVKKIDLGEYRITGNSEMGFLEPSTIWEGKKDSNLMTLGIPSALDRDIAAAFLRTWTIVVRPIYLNLLHLFHFRFFWLVDGVDITSASPDEPSSNLFDTKHNHHERINLKNEVYELKKENRTIRGGENDYS